MSPAGRKYKEVISNHSFSVVFTVCMWEPKSLLSNPTAGWVANWYTDGSNCRPSGCGGKSLNDSSFGGLARPGQGRPAKAPKGNLGLGTETVQNPWLKLAISGNRGPSPSKTWDTVSEGIPGWGLKSTVSTADYFKVGPRVTRGQCLLGTLLAANVESSAQSHSGGSSLWKWGGQLSLVCAFAHQFPSHLGKYADGWPGSIFLSSKPVVQHSQQGRINGKRQNQVPHLAKHHNYWNKVFQNKDSQMYWDVLNPHCFFKGTRVI